MKKLVIALAISLCLAGLAPAQTPLRPGFSFGFKSGLNIADFSGKDVDTAFRTKAGFALGGLLSYQISNALAVQAEALFTQKGSRIFVKVQGTTLNEWVNLSYIEVPLLLKFFPPMESTVRPILFAGPYFAFKVSFKDKWEFGSQNGNEDITTYRGTDTGFAAGGGVDFPVGKGTRMSAEVRYTLGLSTLSQDSAEKGYNAVFSILVQIAFGK